MTVEFANEVADAAYDKYMSEGAISNLKEKYNNLDPKKKFAIKIAAIASLIAIATVCIRKYKEKKIQEKYKTLIDGLKNDQERMIAARNNYSKELEKLENETKELLANKKIKPGVAKTLKNGVPVYGNYSDTDYYKKNMDKLFYDNDDLLTKIENDVVKKINAYVDPKDKALFDKVLNSKLKQHSSLYSKSDLLTQAHAKTSSDRMKELIKKPELQTSRRQQKKEAEEFKNNTKRMFDILDRLEKLKRYKK